MINSRHLIMQYIQKAKALKSISNLLLKTSAIFIVFILVPGCGGGSDERPCARSEDACLIIDPPPVEIWWDAPITDFSDQPDRPNITLLGEKTVILALGDNYIESGAMAEDQQDGDITCLLYTSPSPRD